MQFSSYPRITAVAPGDLFLAHQVLSGTEKTVTFEDIVASIVTTGASGALPNVVLLYDATSGPRNITLPSTEGREGYVTTIKKSDFTRNEIVISGYDTTQLIDGSAIFILSNQNEFVTIQSDGTNWQIVATNITYNPYMNRFYGANVYLTSNEATANTTDLSIPWDAAYYSDLGIWSSAAPTKLFVPAGVTKVRLSAGIRWSANTTGYRNVRIRSNPGGVYAANSIWGAADHIAGENGDCTITTGVIDVQDIEYFEIVVKQASGGALDVRAVEGTYFQMEIVG